MLAAIAAVGTSIAIPGVGLVVAGPDRRRACWRGRRRRDRRRDRNAWWVPVFPSIARAYMILACAVAGILLGVEAKTSDEVDKLETLLEDIGAEYVRAE